MIYSFSMLKQTKYFTNQKIQTKKWNKPICCLVKKQTKLEIRYLQQQKTQKTEHIQKVPIKAPLAARTIFMIFLARVGTY